MSKIIRDLHDLMRDEDEYSLEFLLADHSGNPENKARAEDLIARIKAYPNGAEEDRPDQWEPSGNMIDVAVNEHWARTIPTLVKLGVNVDGANKDGEPLWLAIAMGAELYGLDYRVERPTRKAAVYAEVAKALIESGADVNRKDESGYSMLHFAVGRNNASIVKDLIEHGADVNAKDPQGKTPLHYAHTLDVVLALLKAKPDINAKDKEGDTPFLAVYMNMIRTNYAKKFEKESLKTMEAFLNAGATVNTPNKRGSTLIKEVKMFGVPSEKALLQKFLKERGETMDEVEKLAVEKGLPRDVSGLIKKMAVPLPSEKKPGPFADRAQTVIDFFDTVTMNNPLKLQSAIKSAIDTLGPYNYVEGVPAIVSMLEGLKTDSETLAGLSTYSQRKKMEEIRKKIEEVKTKLKQTKDAARGGKKTRVRKTKRRKTLRRK